MIKPKLSNLKNRFDLNPLLILRSIGYLFTPFFWSTLFVLTIYLLFRSQFIEFLHSQFFFHWLKPESGVNIILSIITIIVSVGMLLHYWKNCLIEKKESTFILIFYALSAFIYLDLRWINRTDYPFQPLEIFESNFYFLDAIITPILVYICVYKIPNKFNEVVNEQLWTKEYKSHLRSKQNELNYFLEDNPAEVTINHFIIEEISKIILTNKYEKSFSIGIVGPWGNGKSTLIKSLIHQLETEKRDDPKAPIIINFSPFLNFNEKEVISEFFTLLSNSIRPYNSQLSHDIIEYANQLSSVSSQTSWIRPFLNIVSQKQSAHESYHKINKTLSSLKQTVVVTIDDLDRLSANEILETLKLIRNTANFPGIVFIIAYDRSFIMNQLKSRNQTLDATYLKKFFQIEYQTRNFNYDEITSFMIDVFKKRISLEPNNKTQEEKTFKTILKKHAKILEPCIQNLRDAKIILNQLKSDFSKLKMQYELEEIFMLTVFKYSHPEYWYYMSHIFDWEGHINEHLFYIEGKNSEKLIQDMLSAAELYESYNIKKEETIAPTSEEKLTHLSIELRANNLLEFINNYFFNEITKECLFGSNLKKFKYLFNSGSTLGFYTHSEFSEFLKLTIDQKIEFIESKTESFEREMRRFINEEILDIRTDLSFYEAILTTHRNINLDFIGNPFKSHINSKELFEEIIESIILQDNQLDILCKLEFIKLYNYNDKICTPNYKEKIEEWVLKKFEIQLNLEWVLEDYKSFTFFHRAKLISEELSNKLKQKFKLYLESNNIDVFCAQVLMNDSFNRNNYYLSEIITELFGKHNNFQKLLKNHPLTTKSISEFQDFTQLMKITHNNPVLYNFISLKTISVQDKQVKIFENSNPMPEVQIFIEIVRRVESRYRPTKVSISNQSITYIHEEQEFYFFKTQRDNPEKCLLEIFKDLKAFYEIRVEEEFESKINFPDKTAILREKNNQEVVAKLISIQYDQP